MIQLEQQQHGEFWVGGVGWWVGWVTHQLPISNSLCGWINKCLLPSKHNYNRIYAIKVQSRLGEISQEGTRWDKAAIKGECSFYSINFRFRVVGLSIGRSSYFRQSSVLFSKVVQDEKQTRYLLVDCNNHDVHKYCQEACI